MKTYTVKSLYRVLGQALKKLPFAITFHGKIKAVVIDPKDMPEEWLRLNKEYLGEEDDEREE